MLDPTVPMTDADLAAADSVLSANGEAIGAIQQALADIVDAHLSENVRVINKVKSHITKTHNRALNHFQTLVNAITAHLGDTANNVMAQNAGVVSTIGNAAATGELASAPHSLVDPTPDPPPINTVAGQAAAPNPGAGPAPPDMSGFDPRINVWVNCTTKEIIVLSISNPAPNIPPGSGWQQIANGLNSGQTTAVGLSTWGDTLARDWMRQHCPVNQPATPVASAAQPPAAPTPLPPVEAPPALPLPLPPTPLPPLADKPVAPITAPIRVQPNDCESVVVVTETRHNYCDWIDAIANQIVTWGEFILSEMADGRNSGHIKTSTMHHVADWLLGSDADKEEITPILGTMPSGDDWWKSLDRWNCLIDALDTNRATRVRAAMAFQLALRAWQDMALGVSYSEGATQGQSQSFGLKALGLGAANETSATTGKGLSLATRIAAAVVPALAIVDQVIAYLMPVAIPSVGEATSQYLAARIDRLELECLIRANGRDPLTTLATVDAQRSKIAADERIELSIRQGDDEVKIRDGLREYGFIHTADVTNKLSLWFNLPAPSDTFQYDIWGTDYPQFAAAYGLRGDFDTVFWPRWQATFESQHVGKTHAEHMYLSHWSQPGIGDMQQMLYRLGPSGNGTGLSFTITDYRNWLSVQGYPAWVSDRLAAVAYQPISLRFIRAALDNGAAGADEITAALAVQGVDPQLLPKLVQSEMWASARRIARSRGRLTISEIPKLVHSNTLTRDQAIANLAGQGYTDADIDDAINAYNGIYISSLEESSRKEALRQYATAVKAAYKDGVTDRATALNALLANGYIATAANLQLDTIDLETRKTTVDEAVKAIRKSYLLGAVDIGGAANALALAGVTASMQQVLLTRWQLELTTPRVAASAALIIKLTVKGIMSIDNMQLRLTNLGWTPDAIQLETIAIQQELLDAQRKATAANAKQLAAAQKQAQALVKQTQGSFCKLYSPSKMVRWYALDIIDDAKFRSRLKQCGYEDDAIADLLAEAKDARTKVQAAATKTHTAAKSKAAAHIAEGTLDRLYSERIIDDAALKTALEQLGYEGSQLSELMEDAKVKRDAKDKESAKKGTTGIQFAGQGTAAK